MQFSRGAIRKSILTLALLAATLPAQTPFGEILGTVTDPSRAVVPGATVRLREVSSNVERVVHTNAEGDFAAPSLSIGQYEITFEAPGFSPAQVPGVILTVDQKVRVDIQLTVGTPQQQVEVQSHVSLIDTDSSAQGSLVDNQRVVALPLNGRNFDNWRCSEPG
jgi:hypothetical protein